MKIIWISYAEWAPEVFTSQYGTHISTDDHQSEGAAKSVCQMLKKEGFGGMGKDFPIRTWWKEVTEK